LGQWVEMRPSFSQRKTEGAVFDAKVWDSLQKRAFCQNFRRWKGEGLPESWRKMGRDRHKLGVRGRSRAEGKDLF